MIRPKFWKLSHGANLFSLTELLESISDKQVYVHNTTRPKGTQSKSQADNFIEADIGDYFYLTHGNAGIYLLGQFIGPANIFTKFKDGWLSRRYDIIQMSTKKSSYTGVQKYWTPNDSSTFQVVPDHDMKLFEEYILKPYFNIELKQHGIDLTIYDTPVVSW